MIETIFLAIVQGIAEFLPISSSGHLAILAALIKSESMTEESPILSIILHGGTLGSILLIYWQKILALLKSDRRVIPLLIAGTIPAGIVGLTIKKHYEEILTNPVLAASMLILTGLMLIVLGKLKPRNGSYQNLGIVGAIVIGCFQAFAILPGISRSGSTILGGRLLGLKDDDSVTFSFLLAIPAIGGAVVLALKDVAEKGPGQHGTWELIIGAIISFVVGIVALKWLIVWSQKARLHWFAWWCIPVGVLILLLFASQSSLDQTSLN